MISESPLVSIRCLAYNHEKYIRQCLDGFIMQETDFPFEIIIHDDASTDGTADVIHEYAKKYSCINAIFESENQYSKHDGSLAKIVNGAIRGKYVALCEGDDYWIDPLKLQKQVSFLENHPDYAMAYTLSKVYNEDNQQVEEMAIGSEYEGYEALLAGNCIPSLTTCIRVDVMMKYVEDVKPQQRGWLMGDYPMWLWIAYYYKIKFFPEITAVYRVLHESASHSQNFQKLEKFIRSTIDITTFYIDKFGTVPTQEYYKALNLSYYNLYDGYMRRGCYKRAKYYKRLVDVRFLSDNKRKKVKLFFLRYLKFRYKRLLNKFKAIA